MSAEELQTRSQVIDTAMRGFRELGAVYVVGCGLDENDIQHQFNVGSVLFDSVNQDEKNRYIARINEDGSWAGYKVDWSDISISLLVLKHRQ
jgi:isopenicillin N synthase-like dioxygenase